MVGRWSDIRTRKKAELRVLREKEHLDVSLKCANLTTWEWKIDEGTIDWFGNVDSIMGVDREQLNSFEKFTLRAHPKDQEPLQTAIRSCLVTNNTIDHECRVGWPDKSVHWIRIRGELICDEEGSPYRMAGVISDISQEKKIQIAPPSALMQVS